MDPVFELWKCFWPETKGKPEPEHNPLAEPPPEEDGWREATLRRLEAWIEEQERIIAEIDRLIAERTNAAGRKVRDGIKTVIR